MRITLTKDWGRYAAGDVLAVWEPGAPLGRGVVDPKRAATLVVDGLAIDGEAAPAAEPKRRRSKV